jgi:methylthioribose-1-phosphate isomerase
LEEKMVDITTVDETYTAIYDMTVRGAPAIGATGAYGMCLVVPVVVNKGGNVVEALEALRSAKEKVLRATYVMYQV